jgi:hypothetical protein
MSLTQSPLNLGHPNEKQQAALITLLHAQKGQEIDGFSAAILLLKLYDLRVDWHETSAALDLMARRGQAWHIGLDFDRMNRYRIL